MSQAGVIVPQELFKGTSVDPAFVDLPEGQAYSLAWILDPAIQSKMNVKVPRTQVHKQREFALDTSSVQTGDRFSGLVREWNPFAVSVTYALLEGDIGSQATGSVPNQTSKSGYAKLASKAENLWSKGLLTAKDLPSVVNPE